MALKISLKTRVVLIFGGISFAMLLAVSLLNNSLSGGVITRHNLDTLSNITLMIDRTLTYAVKTAAGQKLAGMTEYLYQTAVNDFRRGGALASRMAIEAYARSSAREREPRTVFLLGAEGQGPLGGSDEIRKAGETLTDGAGTVLEINGYVVSIRRIDILDSLLCAAVNVKSLPAFMPANNFRSMVLTNIIGKTGYAFIMDYEGTLLVHPTSEGTNIGNLKHIAEILKGSDGSIRYVQATKGQSQGRTKMAVYHKNETMGWFVVGGSYIDEFYSNVAGMAGINAVVLAVSLLLIFLIARIFSTRIMDLLKRIEEKVRNIASGSEKADLTKRIDIHRQDEIGGIAEGVNSLISRLNQDITALSGSAEFIQHSSRESSTLLENALDTDMKAMMHSVQDIELQSQKANTGMDGLVSTLQMLNSNIDGIMKSMERQASAVEEGASSIEEMVRNIENSTSITARTKDLSNNLNSVAQDGGNAVKNAIQSIKDVSEFSRQILKMLQLITNIAKQTNLLAMNASIEAAHAGEAGKGFAIVADEIRRMSEDTNKNAKEIGEVVNAIVNRIGESVQLAEKAGIGLDMVLAYSSQTTQIVQSLAVAMDEQNNGAREILRSTQDLVQITEEVKDSITNQQAATGDFSVALEEIKKITGRNADNMRAFLDNFQAMISKLWKIKEALGKNKDQVEVMGSLVGRFVIDKKAPVEQTGMKLKE